MFSIPIPLSQASFGAVAGEEGSEFVVATLRKQTILRAPTAEDRDAWVSALAVCKQQEIKASMGHVARNTDDKEAHGVAERLYKQGVDVHARMQEHDTARLLSGMPNPF